ncbi:MAG: hypothetical protein ACOYLB_16395 [Phototrophicaceae bacterium]
MSMFIPLMQSVLKWGGLVWLLVGCATLPTLRPTPTVDFTLLAQRGVKQLATVFMSPTPNAGEQQATRLAATAPASLSNMTESVPSPTPYVGIFLGDAASNAGSLLNLTAFAPLAPPTATPAVDLTRCTIAPANDIFGERWMTNAEVVRSMGCPLEVITPFEGRSQVFQGGVMYYRPSGEFWVIVPNGRYWYLGVAPAIEQPPVSAPSGFLIPQFGFGAVWQGQEGVRDALGYALTEEVDASLAYQRFEGGTLFYDRSVDQLYVLVLAGVRVGPF